MNNDKKSIDEFGDTWKKNEMKSVSCKVYGSNKPVDIEVWMAKRWKWQKLNEEMGEKVVETMQQLCLKLLDFIRKCNNKSIHSSL